MAKDHFVRLISIDGDRALVQGPPPPKWLIDLVRPFAKGEIKSVMVCASRTEVTVSANGALTEVIITGPQWEAMGGPAAMRAHGYEQPVKDDWHD